MATLSSMRKKGRSKSGLVVETSAEDIPRDHSDSEGGALNAEDADLDSSDINVEAEHAAVEDDVQHETTSEVAPSGLAVPDLAPKPIRDPHYKLACPQCNRAFKRREHLERHMSVHTGEKPWRCPVCSHSFRRKDTMTRHLKGHRTAQGTFAFVSDLGARAGPSCLQCATSKQKCDGRRPCERCVKKNELCKNATSGTRRARATAVTSTSSEFDGGGYDSDGGAGATSNSSYRGPKSAPAVKFQLSKAMYDKLCNFHNEQRLVLGGWLHHTVLPPRQNMAEFLQLFFDHCASRFPLFHVPSFEPDEKPYTLILAMCIMGCQFCDARVDSMSKHVLQQLAQQAWSLALAKDAQIESLPEAQALLLLSVGLLFDSNLVPYERFQIQQVVLTAYCRELSQKQSSLAAEAGNQAPPRITAKYYQRFLELEEERRFISCSWLLECLADIHLNLSTVLGICDLKRPLPCHEDFWGMSCDELERIDLSQAATRSIYSIMSSGPVENSLCTELGRFSATVMHLTIFVEQRRMQRTVDFWLRPRILHARFMQSTSVLNFNARENDSSAASMLETDVNCFYGRYREAKRPVRLISEFHKYFQVTQILRFVEYRILCAWLGFSLSDSPSGDCSQDAATELTKVFANDRPRARKVLLYSTELYLRYRDIKAVPCQDLHCLFAAASYICAWVALASESMPWYDVEADKIQPAAHQVVSLDSLDVPTAQQWVLSGHELVPRIEVTGLLRGQQAVKSILRETSSIITQKGLPSSLGAAMVACCKNRVLKTSLANNDRRL